MYTVIVVDYNTIEKTIDYIKHCKRQLIQQDMFHAIVVDNGTRTDTLDIVNSVFGEGEKIVTSLEKETYLYNSKQFGEIVLCLAKENLGYAKGNNLGASLAKEVFRDSYYLICNNDLIIKEVIELKKVTDVFNDYPQVAVIGPYIEGVDGSVQNPHKYQNAFCKLILWYWNIMFFHLFENAICDIDYDGKSKVCDWVTGCFLFVKADAFEKAGMFDEHTFLYGEELILCKRLESIGFSCYFYNNIRIIHNHGETVKKSVSIIDNVKYCYDSMFYFYKEYIHTADWMLVWAQLNFRLYKMLYVFKQMLKKIARKE